MISSKRIRLMGQKVIDFISSWKTDNTSTGSSNDDQVKLPLDSSGTYNFVVDWGDSSTDTITAWDQSEVTHTYSSIGTYEIKITGQCEVFRFNNTGDRLKLLDISNWGNEEFRFGNDGGIFYGCSNLNISATDDAITTITNSLTNCERFFEGCTSFNGDVSNFDTSNVTNMSSMFYNCNAFNQSVSNFDTSNVTDMSSMFRYCNAFNQDISNFDISLVTIMNNMLSFAENWSTANYDAFLISAAGQSVQSEVSFGCSSYYTSGGAAEAARTSLINDDSWSITDLGGV